MGLTTVALTCGDTALGCCARCSTPSSSTRSLVRSTGGGQWSLWLALDSPDRLPTSSRARAKGQTPAARCRRRSARPTRCAGGLVVRREPSADEGPAACVVAARAPVAAAPPRVVRVDQRADAHVWSLGWTRGSSAGDSTSATTRRALRTGQAGEVRPAMARVSDRSKSAGRAAPRPRGQLGSSNRTAETDGVWCASRQWLGIALLRKVSTRVVYACGCSPNAFVWVASGTYQSVALGPISAR